MRRKLAVTALALVAACTQEGSTAGAADPEALAFFHVAASGEGRVTFASSATEGDAQVLTDVAFKNDEGVDARAETLRLVGARQTPDGAVFDSLEIAGFTASDGFDKFAIDRILIEDPNPLLASLIAQTLSSQGVDESADWGKPSDYAFGAMAIEGFSADGEGGEVKLGALRMSDWAGGSLGELVVEQVSGAGEAEGSEVGFALDSWRMTALDLTGVDAFADVDVDDEAAIQQAIAESGLSNPFEKRFDAYDLSGLNLNIDGVMLDVDSVTGAAEETDQGVVTKEALNGLVVSFDDTKELGAQALQSLALLGYDRIEMSGRFEQAANPKTDRISAETYVLEAKDAFTLELDYDLGGVQSYLASVSKLSASGEEMTPEQATEAFGALVVHAFELRLRDDSLIDRALQATATSQGSTPEAVRQQAVAMLTVGTMMAPPGAAEILASDFISAASKFLESPGTLTIAMEPAEPVKLDALMSAFEASDYDQALGLMSLRIEASE